MAKNAEKQVLFLEGNNFSPDGKGHENKLRLSFVRYGPNDLQDGIRRLAALLREMNA